MLKIELGIDPDDASNNNGSNIKDRLIIHHDFENMQKNFKLKVSQNNKVLPNLYLIPKLHKNFTKRSIYHSISGMFLKPHQSLKECIKFLKTKVANIVIYLVWIIFGQFWIAKQWKLRLRTWTNEARLNLKWHFISLSYTLRYLIAIFCKSCMSWLNFFLM